MLVLTHRIPVNASALKPMATDGANGLLKSRSVIAVAGAVF